MTYLCENGHTFDLVPGGNVSDPAYFKCLVCGSTSERHRITNGGVGRIFHLDFVYDEPKPDDADGGEK